MSFYNCKDIYCPICSINPGSLLECVEQNYSDCGIDIGRCSKCGKLFQISYCVAEIYEI